MIRFRPLLAAGLAALLCLPAPPAPAQLPAAEQQRFADGLFSRGLWDMALVEYQRALKEHPDYPERDLLLFRASECSRKLGDAAGATALLQQVLALNKPGSYLDRSRLRLAEAAIHGQRVGEAVPLLEQVLAARPGGDTEAAAHYYLGLARLKNGETEAGRKSFSTVVERHPETAFAAYAALELTRLLNAAGAPFPEIQAMASRVLARPPTKPVATEVALLLMEAAERAGDFPGAAAAYLQLLKDAPEDPQVRAGALKAAWACLRAGRFAELLTVLPVIPAEIRAAHPADILYLEANALRKTGSNAQSLARYYELTARFPDSPYTIPAAYETALVAHASKRFEEVVSRRAWMDKDPAFAADGGWLVADALRELGRTEEAVAAYLAWSGKHSADPRAADGLYLAAQLRQQQQRFADAAGIYGQLAEKHPAHALAPRALYGRALTLLADSRLDEAVKSWLALADAHPRHDLAVESLLQAGLALIKLGRGDEAIPVLTRILAAKPADMKEAQAAYWLGIVQEQKKDFAAAEPAFRRVIEIQPEPVLTARASLRLALTLQKLDRPGDAARLLQDLLDQPVAAEMEPALLEWLARHALQNDRPAEAIRPAAMLAGHKSADAQWVLIGRHTQGTALRKTGKAAEALAAFREAEKINLNTRERADASLQAGELLLDSAKPADAAKAFEEGSSRASSLGLVDLQARGYLGLGRAALAAGKDDDAARYFLSVAVLFDDPVSTPEALRLAASTLRKLGRTAEADRAEEELKKRYPGKEEKTEMPKS